MYIFNGGWWVIQSIHVYVLLIADCIGIYGEMHTWIIRCIGMIFPLTSSKYTQATNQSCWSEEFGACNGGQVGI